MKQPRIHTTLPLTENEIIQLEENAANHIARVLRMRANDSITLFNGDGCEYPATIQTIDRKHVSVQVQSQLTVNRESPLHTHLGIVISRGDRMDWVLQKATELGVSEITPLTSERCEVKLKGDRADKKMQHWQGVCISACEQCQRNQIPVINNLSPFEDWINSVNTSLKLVLHHRSAQAMQKFNKPESLAILIGPEGGLSDEEIQRAEAQQFQSTLMGPRVLRTETAPIVALSLAQNLWGDLN